MNLSVNTLKTEKPDTHQESLLALSKVEKITALWALSESTMGGLLHALKLPFRGMIISGAAIILIAMIAKFSDKRGQIIKSTLSVIFIKAAISPHSPVMAYISVLLQGLLGELFYFSKKVRLLSSLLLGISVSLLNGFQKVLVLTLIYGNTLWKSIDDLLNYIAKEWFFLNIINPVEFSFFLISFYVGMHLIIGIACGILAYTIPKSVEKKLKESVLFIPLTINISNDEISVKPKRRRWLKPSSAVIFILSIVLITLSYFYPLTDNVSINDILIMLGRSVIIMLIWFYFLAPRITNFLKKYFYKKHGEYARDINSFLASAPVLKSITVTAWKSSANLKGIKRLNLFMITTLVYLLKDYDNN